MTANLTSQHMPDDKVWDFNSLAATYDQQVAAEHGQPYHVWGDYQKCIARVLELAAPVAGVDAIDVATGTGVLAIALAQAGCSVLAVDPSAEMLAQGQLKVALLPDIQRRITWQQVAAPFLELPVAASSADLIVSTYALHHLSEPRKHQAMAELVRVLRPGGRLVIGDLMFANESAREDALSTLRRLNLTEVVADIEDEYWGMAEGLVTCLENLCLIAHGEELGFQTWVLYGQKPTEPGTSSSHSTQ